MTVVCRHRLKVQQFSCITGDQGLTVIQRNLYHVPPLVVCGVQIHKRYSFTS